MKDAFGYYINFDTKNDLGINAPKDSDYIFSFDYPISFDEVVDIIREMYSYYGDFDMTNKDLWNFLNDITDIESNILESDKFLQIAKDKYLGDAQTKVIEAIKDEQEAERKWKETFGEQEEN